MSVTGTGHKRPLTRQELTVFYALATLALLGRESITYGELRRVVGITDTSARRAVRAALEAGLVTVEHTWAPGGGHAPALIRLTPTAAELLRLLRRSAAEEFARCSI